MKYVGLGVLAGIALAFLFTWTLGFTLAIAAPADFFAGGESLVPFRLFLWELLVVNGLGVGLIAVVVAALASWAMPVAALRICATAAAVAWAVAHFVVPVLHGGTVVSPFGRYWWGYGFETMLLLGLVFVPWLIGRIRRPAAD